MSRIYTRDTNQLYANPFIGMKVKLNAKHPSTTFHHKPNSIALFQQKRHQFGVCACTVYVCVCESVCVYVAVVSAHQNNNVYGAWLVCSTISLTAISSHVLFSSAALVVHRCERVL